MAEHVALRPLTIHGEQYKAGDRIPMEKLTPDRRRQLVSQRFVAPHAAKVGRPRKEG